jgi:hypothetical protein
MATFNVQETRIVTMNLNPNRALLRDSPKGGGLVRGRGLSISPLFTRRQKNPILTVNNAN